MKLLIALLAAVGLSGCVAYGGAPYGSYGSADVYYSTGSPYYSNGYYGNPYYGTPSATYIYGNTYRSAPRDQDRDGVPNRVDRDRDGDGVPNRRDSYPYDPRRR
jgi:hypothetical protein